MSGSGLPRTAVAGLTLLALLALLALSAPLIVTERPWLAREEGRLRILPGPPGPGAERQVLVAAPVSRDPRRVDLRAALAPPSLEHPFGTDSLGRDLLARVVHGARASFGAGLLATALAAAIAVLLAGASVFAPRALDELIARGADVVHAFPLLVGALALLGGLSPIRALPPLFGVALAVGLFAWPGLYRLVRAEMSRWKSSDVAAAARASGARNARVAVVHLVPLVLAPTAGPAAFLAGGALLAEAGLGFLGVGIGPPDPSWGGLLREGFGEPRSAWWLTAFPGGFVFLAVLGFHLVADGLAAGPRRRSA